MVMALSEYHYYELSNEMYNLWLDRFCAETPADEVTPEDIRESLRDWIICNGHCEVEPNDDNDLDCGVEDVMARLDPGGKRAQRRELEAQLQDAYARVEQLHLAIRELGV